MSVQGSLGDAPRFLAGLPITGVGLADGKGLRWNDTTKLWEFFTPASFAGDKPLLTTTIFNDVVDGSPLAGDLIYGNNTPKWTKLAKGANGDILTLAAGLPSWLGLGAGYVKGGAPLSVQSGIPLADLQNVGGAAGDILYWNGANWVRLAVGANGQVLQLAAGLPSWATIGITSSRDVIGCSCSSYPNNSNLFQPIFAGDQNHLGTEATVDVPITYGFTVKRLRAVVDLNTKGAATTLGFRDDGADVATLAVAAGATGEFDSGAISVAVAAGSKVCFRQDTSASAAGNLSIANLFVEIEVALV